MATFYALPTLTTWVNSGAATGWSYSSGGADNGTCPASGDDVVFNASSGSSRTVTVNGAVCRSLNMTSGPTINFTSATGNSVQMNIYGSGTTSTDMTNAASLGANVVLNLGLAYTGATTPAFNFKPPGSTAVGMNVYGGFTLTGPLTVGGTITMLSQADSNGNSLPMTVSLGGYAVQAAAYADSSGSATTLNVQGSTLTLTGAGLSNNAQMFSAGSTVNWGNGTLKCTAANSGVLNVIYASSDGTGNVWVAASPTSGLYYQAASSTAYVNNFRVDPGCSVFIPSGGVTLSANSFTVNATSASRARLQGTSNTSPSAVTLRSGATQSRQYFQYADVVAINFLVANIFYGIQCTQQYTTNFTAYRPRTNFFGFLL